MQLSQGPNVSLPLASRLQVSSWEEIPASVTWDDKTINDFCNHLAAIPIDTSVLITASRRTPDKLREAALIALKQHHHWIWKGEEPNPYVEILAYSDRLIITGDSHNMVSEALSVGVPVHVYRPPGLHKKLTEFLDRMEHQRFIQNISQGYARTEAQRLDSTPEIAAKILERFTAWQTE